MAAGGDAMGDLARIFDGPGGPWLAALLRASLYGGAALAIAWLLCRVLRKLSPAWKSWLLRLAYLKVLVALCLAAQINLPLLRPDGQGQTLSPLAPFAPAPIGQLNGPVATRAEPPPRRRVRLNRVLLAIWMAGSGVSIVFVCIRWRAATRLRRGSSALSDGPTRHGYDALARAMGVRRPPALRASDLATGPLLVGLIRPAIVLPVRLIGGDAARLRLMLAHELAHYRRHDLQWGLLPMVVRVLLWFHPVVWLAEREWWLARETACDALAVRATGASAAEYGWTLLEAATAVAPARGAVSRFAAAGVIESRSTIERRLSAMQNLSVASPRRWMFIGSALVVAAALALVPVRLTAQAAAPSAANDSKAGAGAANGGSAPATESAWKGAGLSFPGTVEGRTAAVRPAIDGVVSVAQCELGQAVKAGDLLFQLDDAVARAQLAAAEAQYEVVRARADEYEKVGKGIVTENDRREAVAQRQAAAAEIRVKQAVLEQARILAPFAGVVSQRDANVGEVVKRGEPLATIVQLDPLGVLISVPQSVYPQLHVGQAARVRGNVLGNGFADAKVSFISPQFDPSTGTAAVKVAVSNADGKLKPGMFVNVEILVSGAASEPAK